MLGTVRPESHEPTASIVRQWLPRPASAKAEQLAKQSVLHPYILFDFFHTDWAGREPDSATKMVEGGMRG